MLQGFLQGLKELAFPDNCLLCRSFLNSRHSQQLCAGCLSRIKLNTPPFCLKCSRHLELPTPDGLCPTCVKTSYAFDQAWGVCSYDDALPSLIHQFKYDGKTSLRFTFSRLMFDFINQYQIPMDNFDMIIPMPLHPTRLRERGYNQSQLIAELLSRHLSLPCHQHLMERTKHTPTQTALEAKQRWTNMEGAFRIDHSLDIADKNVLIIDDLLTTAATAHAASCALKEAGAAYVGILTLAITHEDPAQLHP